MGPGRPPKPRLLSFQPKTVVFIPHDENGNPIPPKSPVSLAPDEYEAFILVYFLGLRQEEAAVKMGISRGTLWRCLESARRKIGQALSELRPIIVNPVNQQR